MCIGSLSGTSVIHGALLESSIAEGAPCPLEALGYERIFTVRRRGGRCTYSSNESLRSPRRPTLSHGALGTRGASAEIITNLRSWTLQLIILRTHFRKAGLKKLWLCIWWRRRLTFCVKPRPQNSQRKSLRPPHSYLRCLARLGLCL